MKIEVSRESGDIGKHVSSSVSYIATREAVLKSFEK